MKKKQHLNKMEIEVELPHWIIETIQNKALLKISSDYLTKDLTNLFKHELKKIIVNQSIYP